MQSEDEIRDTFAKQAVWCERLGSPLTTRLVTGLGLHLDRSTKTGRRVLGWQGRADALGDAVALRLAGALNALVARGRLPQLATAYPPNKIPQEAVLTRHALTAIADADDEVCQWLDYPPQTNEVARSGILYPGMCFIAEATGLPLALYEVGTSGGLNLFPDRFSYRFGNERRGDETSGVVLSPDWSGASPPAVEPRIVRRMGCDRSPLDVTRADHRERLMAYIWPDQAERIKRIEAAIAIARSDPPDLSAADAADWVEAQILLEPERGVTRVLFHSIAYQYFPDAVKQRIQARMEQAGALATAQAPLAWLAFEQNSDDGPLLTLRMWPGGEMQELAVAGAHVHAVRWKGE